MYRTVPPGFGRVEHVLGQRGKGWLFPGGAIFTWPVGPRGGPHHFTVYRRLGLPPEFLPPTDQTRGGWLPHEGRALPFNITAAGRIQDDDWQEALDRRQIQAIVAAVKLAGAGRHENA